MAGHHPWWNLINKNALKQAQSKTLKPQTIDELFEELHLNTMLENENGDGDEKYDIDVFTELNE